MEAEEGLWFQEAEEAEEAEEAGIVSGAHGVYEDGVDRRLVSPRYDEAAECDEGLWSQEAEEAEEAGVVSGARGVNDVDVLCCLLCLGDFLRDLLFFLLFLTVDCLVGATPPFEDRSAKRRRH